MSRAGLPGGAASVLGLPEADESWAGAQLEAARRYKQAIVAAWITG
ncbi:MAG: hypothetical protein ACRDO0_11850 [Nocardioidaceae bacterium]